MGEIISTITKIVLEDENPLKLDDHGFVRYHESQIRKLKTVVNGRLEDSPTAAVWRETAELHLQPGELQNYYGKKLTEAHRLSGIQQIFSDGISDWARKWGLPSDLGHMSGKKNNEDEMDETTNEEDEKSNDENNNDSSNGEEETAPQQ